MDHAPTSAFAPPVLPSARRPVNTLTRGTKRYLGSEFIEQKACRFATSSIIVKKTGILSSERGRLPYDTLISPPILPTATEKEISSHSHFSLNTRHRDHHRASPLHAIWKDQKKKGFLHSVGVVYCDYLPPTLAVLGIRQRSLGQEQASGRTDRRRHTRHDCLENEIGTTVASCSS